VYRRSGVNVKSEHFIIEIKAVMTRHHIDLLTPTARAGVS